MTNLGKIGINAALLTALLFVISGVARSEETPGIPPGVHAYVAQASHDRDCLVVFKHHGEPREEIGCLPLCKKVRLTGKASDIMVQISAPLSGWVNGLKLDPNRMACKSLAPYFGDASDDPGDYAEWWSCPGCGWYWHWWWHHRHDPRHFFHDRNPGKHHGHYKSHHSPSHPVKPHTEHIEHKEHREHSRDREHGEHRGHEEHREHGQHGGHEGHR